MRQSPPFNPKPDDEPDVTRPGFGPGLTGLRKKGTGVRAWLVLDSTGQAQVVEAGKHSIMRRTGLPARDLRILDPLLSYPSTVLGREKAIVINLEHIKAIITAQEVLLLNSKDPSVTPFVEELQRRLLRLHQATKNQEARGSADNAEWTDLYDLEGTRSTDVSPPNESYGFPQAQGTKDEKDNMEEKQDLKNRDVVKVLPFEFIALEACLEAACSSLDNEARTLEQEAHPALDKLTSKISTLNLERVRQIKSRLVALTGRVQKVRDELEHLLDDDEDMAEMYLTEKLAQQNLENSSVSSMDDHDVADGDQPEMEERMGAEILSEAHTGSGRYQGDAPNPQDHYFGPPATLARSGTRTSTTRSAISKHLDVEELEMLLEAYFVQIDGTLNKLTTVCR